jgi:hypothetical protein
VPDPQADLGHQLKHFLLQLGRTQEEVGVGGAVPPQFTVRHE